jgi:hypothetical protein
MPGTEDEVELFFEDGSPVNEDELETGDIVYDADGEAYGYTAPEDIEQEMELVGKAAPAWARRAASRVGRTRRPGSEAGFRGHQVNPGPNRQRPSTAEESARAFAGDSRTGRARHAASRAGDRVWGNGKTAAGRKVIAGTTAGGVAVGAGGYESGKHVGKSLSDQVSEALSKAYTDADRDEIIKSFAGIIEERDAELNVLAEIAKSERDLRLEGEYIEVAKGLGLPGDPDELGPVLKRMSELMDPADVQIIAKTLEATSGVLYEEFGYDGFGAEVGDPHMADAEAAAEQRIAKSGSGAGEVSKAVAIEQYYTENPSAYDEYMSGRRG